MKFYNVVKIEDKYAVRVRSFWEHIFNYGGEYVELKNGSNYVWSRNCSLFCSSCLTSDKEVAVKKYNSLDTKEEVVL